MSSAGKSQETIICHANSYYISRPEEFSIQSATKRLDIFEEDRKRILRSPWFPGQDEECTRPKLASKSGVYDFFADWTPDILTDLNQLSDAVDHVLGIVPQNHVDQQPNNVEPPNYPHVNNINDLNKIKDCLLYTSPSPRDRG